MRPPLSPRLRAAHSTKTPSGVEPAPARLARHAVVLIAAVARNGVIGRAGRMPWTLPGDLAHFRRTTTGHPLIMGRRTFEAIGGPLPGRPTVVLSADRAFSAAAVTVARTLADAMEQADRLADDLGADAIMVAGGAAVYTATIGRAERILLTLIDAEPLGDTWFPSINPDIWVEAERRPAPNAPGDSARYEFVRLERRSPANVMAVAG